MEKKLIVIRGGGDVASGVAACLHEAGYGVVVTELAEPLVVRRKVSFADAVFEGSCSVEGIIGRKVDDPEKTLDVLAANEVAVLVDPEGECVAKLDPIAIVDGRLLKRNVADVFAPRWKVIGLGPGFTAGENCWAAIETNRGDHLGDIFFEGSPEPDTGTPAAVMGYRLERVLYTPTSGRFTALLKIGDLVDAGQTVAEVDGKPIVSQIKGVVRGLLWDGLEVNAGVKVGDVDPTGNPEVCFQISDKARKIGMAVVEALGDLEIAR